MILERTSVEELSVCFVIFHCFTLQVLFDLFLCSTRSSLKNTSSHRITHLNEEVKNSHWDDHHQKDGRAIAYDKHCSDHHRHGDHPEPHCDWYVHIQCVHIGGKPYTVG